LKRNVEPGKVWSALHKNVEGWEIAPKPDQAKVWKDGYDWLIANG
jgi:hypothetical protein